MDILGSKLKIILLILLSFSSPALWAQSQTGGSFLGTGSTLHPQSENTDSGELQHRVGSATDAMENRSVESVKTGSYQDDVTSSSGVSLYPTKNPSINANSLEQEQR